MGTYMMRFLLMLKSRLKNPFTYIWVFLLALSLYLVRESVVPLEQPSEVLILNEAGEYGDRVMDVLEGRDSDHSDCTFAFAENEESLREMVMRGQARCGFIFPEDMEERIASGDTRSMITMVTSTFSIKSAAVRETVFAALFRVMNEDITVNAASGFFDDPDTVGEYIRERYAYLVESDDVFGLEYEMFKQENAGGTGFFNDRSDPVRGTAAVMIFILCLYSGSSFYGKDGRFFRALRKGERMVCVFLHELSSVLIPSVFGFVSIRMLDGESVPIGREILCFSVFLILTCIWSGVFVSFFKKSETYLPVVSVLLFMSFALCPVFFDPGKYIPVLGYVVRILPPAFYLYMI